MNFWLNLLFVISKLDCSYYLPASIKYITTYWNEFSNSIRSFVKNSIRCKSFFYSPRSHKRARCTVRDLGSEFVASCKQTFFLEPVLWRGDIDGVTWPCTVWFSLYLPYAIFSYVVKYYSKMWMLLKKLLPPVRSKFHVNQESLLHSNGVFVSLSPSFIKQRWR